MPPRRTSSLHALAGLLAGVRADVYLNNPRGSNNKLSEQSNNVQNDNRLFDSQNNAAAGYQIGDKCNPVCQDENRNYDEDKAGAMQGVMTFYQGSELYIEWYAQHGCGVGHPNLRCQVILQYMTEADNSGLRDGTKRGNDNTAGGQREPPTEDDAADITLGQHETFEYYTACKARERNKGLYTADQQVRDDRGATATRQNPGGNNNANNRHGLECPEERDYYPYWHPSPWHDIAVLTDEPQARCSYYQAESQNVKGKGHCSEDEFNNPKACIAAEGTWEEDPPFEEPPPECVGGIRSRDNHNGNVRNGMPMYYVWRIPDYVSGRAVLRLRYNITTADLDPDALISQEEGGPASQGREISDQFFIDEAFNDRDPSQRRRSIFRGGPPILANDPQADWVNLGLKGDEQTRLLQLQFNTAQVARTFEDRTHTFLVRPRPSDVPLGARLVNYNVRGRRGNIVQVYPSVEYDFVPPDLRVAQGTWLHFQWAGSDANPKGNAGNGRQGTDRSNLVQVSERGENVPLPIERHTLFFDAANEPDNAEGRALVDRFAYLDQDSVVTCDPEQDDEQATDNCKQLNGASAYFDGGVVEMLQVGTHHVASTRNNDFSNRSQKATITVTKSSWEWYFVLTTTVGALGIVALGIYTGIAVYAFRRPTSIFFSKRYRPRILRLVLKSETLQKKIEERKKYSEERWENLTASVMLSAETAPACLGRPSGTREDARGDGQAGAAQLAVSAGPKTLWDRCLRRSRSLGLEEQRLVLLVYMLLNIVVFLIGFCSHLDMGFQGSSAYPWAKGAGFTLDLNCAIVVLPTLKSLQTALRGAGATREWIPIDDPISFHIYVAGLIMLGTVVHVVAHVAHMSLIRNAPIMQGDPLQLWDLSTAEIQSGTPIWSQVWDLGGRCAPVTGALVALLMFAMGVTALPCARRGTNRLSKRLGGYNLFWRVHLAWKWIYVLLLLHAPGRLWIWFLFPAMFVAVDRLLLANRQRPYVVLRTAKALARDVISLTFEQPEGFTYQAGQYVLLGWRGEWHPFTLTSAPEEQYLSLHIRAPNSLDWCSALRRRLLEEAPSTAEAAAARRNPAAALAGGASEGGSPSRGSAEGPKGGNSGGKAAGPAWVEYSARVCPRSHVIYCQPILRGQGEAWTASAAASSSAPAGSAAARRKPSAGSASSPTSLRRFATCASLDIERGISAETVEPSRIEAVLPKDAVVLQLSGPFGAPAQKVWQFETIMAVGAGIGVTPFASILRSVQLRARQRKAIQGVLTATQPRSSKKDRKQEEQLSASLDTRESIEQLLRDVVTVPKRIYFYWIVRSQEELNWFYDLLEAAIEGPARDNVYISVFLTGEVELKQVRELKCTQSQYFGRPNWARIFKQVREEHKGEHIGVFLCGSPVIGQELARQSAKHTDAPSVEGGTRFSFFKEHF